MDKEHFKKLERVASFLDELPKEKFDFRSIISQWNDNHTCGTVCCAVGFFPEIFPESFDWLTVYSFNNNVTKEPILDFLGLTAKEANTLFVPYYFNDLSNTAQPKEVAEHIRNFIKTKSQEQNASCQTGNI